MATLHAISTERHGQKRWQRPTSYTFAGNDTVVTLVAAELAKAVLSLPIAFIEQSGSFVPAALLSLLPGKNLFVAPDGRWAGQYIPAAYRAYPFRLANTEQGTQVLAINEDSGLVTDGPDGEAFFGDDGQPTPGIANVLDLLNQIERSRQATATACAALHQHQLIVPWPVTFKTDAGEQQITDLWQIDEAALNQISAEALFDVRQAGGLAVAYCQLLSMQHLSLLGELSKAHATVAAQALAAQNHPPLSDLDQLFANQGETISFRNLW